MKLPILNVNNKLIKRISLDTYLDIIFDDTFYLLSQINKLYKSDKLSFYNIKSLKHN